MHSTGSGVTGVAGATGYAEYENTSEESEEEEYVRRPNKRAKKLDTPPSSSKKSKKPSKSMAKVIDRVAKNGGVIVTTYSTVRAYCDTLLDIEWGYCVLDEGHKIRNPDATITQTLKTVKTCNRIILSGTPIVRE